MQTETLNGVISAENLGKLKDAGFVARLGNFKNAFVKPGVYWETEKPLIDQSPLAVELAATNRYKATLAAVLQKRLNKTINKADFEFYKPLAEEIQILADGMGFDSKNPDLNIVTFIDCCLDKIGILETETPQEKQETQLVKLRQEHLDRIDPAKHPAIADHLLKQFKKKKKGAWNNEVAQIITSDRALRELIVTNKRITPLLIYDLENLLRRPVTPAEMKDVRKMAGALIRLADSCQLYSSVVDLDLLGFVRAARFKAGYTTKEYEKMLRQLKSDDPSLSIRISENRQSRIPRKLLPIPIAIGILGIIVHLQGLPIFQSQQPQPPIIEPTPIRASLPSNYPDTPLPSLPVSQKSNEPLRSEITMPQFKLEHIINHSPKSIPRERIGNPPDLGTAYQLALWGDPYWQKVFMEAYKGTNIQSSVQMRWNNTEGKPTPPIWSWGDYIYLSPRLVPDQQYLINVDPNTRKPDYEQVLWQNDIALSKDIKISGVKIFDHVPQGIGILEKLWFTASPDHKPNVFGQMQEILNPEILAEVIDKIYFVIDGEITSYNPKDLFAGKNPTLGKYERGGFVFNPLISYKRRAQVYLTSNAKPGNPYRHEGLYDQLYYRVIGQDFDNNITRVIPALEAQSNARREFFGKYQQVENTFPKEEFSIKERALVENTWTKTIENSGFSKFTFRAPTPEDLKNTHLNIKYPEADVPAVDINLSELVGTDNVKFSLANRFISFTTGENGGLKIDFNQGIPLPEGTQITLSTGGKAKTEIFWQHRADKIGNLRFGVFHQKLDRNQSTDGKQEFNPVKKDFIVNQLMVYVDDPMVDIPKYNLDPTRFGAGGYKDKLFPWNEGNLYLRELDGTLVSLSNGMEEYGDAAYYSVDEAGLLGFIHSETAIGDTHKMYYFGKGYYVFKFDADNFLKEVVLKDNNDMYSLGFMNSMLKMKKGTRILSIPGFATFESAGVDLTMFGYYNTSQ